MIQDPLAGPLNPIQRFWLTRMLPRYRKLDAETFGLIVERDKFLLSAKAVGMWIGVVCGIVGTTFGLSLSGLTPWVAGVSAVLLAALQHWVDVGDARAAPLLRALTGFLRGSTELMLRDGVTLAQECALVRHYLAIMQSRLGQRLPPGLLVTLVENAVEHGIEPQLHGGEVQVIARHLDTANGVFELRVLDDGAGLAAGLGGGAEGVGPINSRERLRHQFGTRAELLVRPRADGPGTEVCLRVHP